MVTRRLLHFLCRLIPIPFTLSLGGLFPSQALSPLVHPNPRKGLSSKCSDASFASRMGLRDLTPLQCAVTDEHRVLQVFSRNRTASSPLDATLRSTRVSVDSKWFNGNAKSFRCNTYKKQGGGGAALLRRSDVQTLRRSHDPSVPLQPDFLGATMSEVPQRTTRCGKHFSPRRCLRVRERTSGTVHQRSRSQVVPGSSVLTQRAWVSGFVLTNP